MLNCFLDQDTLINSLWVKLGKWWLRPNVTEKLLTLMLSYKYKQKLLLAFLSIRMMHIIAQNHFIILSSHITMSIMLQILIRQTPFIMFKASFSIYSQYVQRNKQSVCKYLSRNNLL